MSEEKREEGNFSYQPPEAELKEVPVPGVQFKGVRFLAAVQVVGGILSLFTIFAFLSIDGIGLVGVAFCALMLALLLLQIYTGVNLWRGRRWAYWVGGAIYFIQILVVSTNALIYQLCLGLGFVIFAQDWVINFEFYLGGHFSIYLGAAVEAPRLGLNIFALIACLYLFYCGSEFKKHE